jgi:hypothetical protein
VDLHMDFSRQLKFRRLQKGLHVIVNTIPIFVVVGASGLAQSCGS